MKSLLPALLLLPALSSAADKDPLPLGIEAVTGYRSDYEFRGFRLAQNLLDVQVQGEVALSNAWLLDFGGSYGTGTGSKNFSEGSAFASLKYDTKPWTAALDATLHDYQNSFFRDGLDIAPSFTWHFSKDLNLGASLAYDTGATGFYQNIELTWSHPVTESSFVSVKGGTSFVEDYYNRSGWNDVYGRLGYTYAFNKNVSVTPFAGFSLATRSRDHADTAYAGLWFEVNF